MTTANIYLDYQATTPLDERVLEAMLPWLGRPANPHSREHAFGQDAAAVIEVARVQVAEAVDGDPEGVVFTASATEAANIVIRSFASATEIGLIISAIEHPCVAATAAECMQDGRTVVATAPVDEDGLVDLDALSELMVDARPSFDHGGQQRSRNDPADRAHRSTVCRGGSAAAYGRDAGDWPGAS